MIDKKTLLKTWICHATVYKWLHDRSAKSMFKKKLCISIPLLILNTLGGIIVYKADSFMTTSKRLLIFECVCGSINMCCVMLTGIKDYFCFGEKSELHIQSFQNWTKFKNEIYVEMVLPTLSEEEFLGQMKIRYVDLISYGPTIPNEIINIYVKKFKEDIENTEFSLPDIIYAGYLKTEKVQKEEHIDLDSII